MKKRIFSAIQPSGALHIGNYLGAIRNWVALQKDYRSIFCVADLHALTVPQDPSALAANTRRVISTYVAAGIDPAKNIIFVQSQVPAHTELAWILNTIAKIPELERMTQFKDKAEAHRQQVNMGLFDYPVLMAADILLYHTNIVPVGEDQKQHVELSRVLARRFNHQFGKTFTMPSPLILKLEEGARIMSLAAPDKKMSKSIPQGCLFLDDAPGAIQDKIKKAVTDSGKDIQYSADKPAISNLLTIYHGCSGMSVKSIVQKYKSKGYAQFKKDLAEIVIKTIEPLRKRQIKDEKRLDQIAQEGAAKAQDIANKTLTDVRTKVGLI